MTALLSNALVLASGVLAAEVGGPAPGPASGPAQTNPMAGIWTLLPFVLILIAFFWFTSRSQKKREQKRQEMLSSIKLKDDVMTIGGIHGRVVQIRDDEFVLRVDDDKDVKITVSKNAVSRRVGEPEPS
jgi:preprotein translocase subunit YajC